MTKQFLPDLKPNPRNPRKVTDTKLRMLKDSLARFGDLSGIVVNRTSGNQVVGGHQRLKAFAQLGALDAVIEHTYEHKTSAGTVAEGYVAVEGERFAYREVEWTSDEEKAANLAANKGAGEWRLDQVAEWVSELDDVNFDLDLTMFDADDRAALIPKQEPEPEPDETDLKIEEGYRILIECSSEGHQFELMERFNAEGLSCKPLIS